MVVIEFDLPRSVSLSALDENNVTLKDTPENGGYEADKMVPRATLICRPNSHPFQERNLALDSAIKVGRAVARVKPATNNAIFDCKVLSRNHALLWYKEGKFYLQDTKSSNGTFVNNQRLSKGSEESTPREVCSGDIVQFGVDVMENSRKVTHGCIVATVKLYLPDGKEAKASPSTGIQEEESNCDLGKQDLYQLNQWIQEAIIREQILENKLGSLQRIVNATREAAEVGWTALMEEDRLLTRIESLENQLIVSSKNFHEDKLREEIRKLYDEKNVYQDASKESLRKILSEKMAAVKKLQEIKRALSNAEDERDNMKELNDKLNEQILQLADKFEKETEELQCCKKKLEEMETLQQRVEQETKLRQEAIQEAQEKETVLLAQMESRQAEIDFTKEQLANLRLRLDSIKVDENNDEKDSSQVDEKINTEHHDDVLKQRLIQLESQLKIAQTKQAINGDALLDPIGFKSKEIDRLKGSCTWDCYLYRDQLACCSLILRELLDETRAKCRQLECEVEKRQLEARDGWSVAAQLQQHFRNLHNALRNTSSDPDDDEELGADPSEIAKFVRSSIVALKNEFTDLQTAQKNSEEIIGQLTKRIKEFENDSRFNQEEVDGDAKYLKDEVASLTIQLKEKEMLRIDLVEERQKWQLAYQSLALACETRDSGVSYPLSADPGERDRDSHLSLSSDELLVGDSIVQLSNARMELETLRRCYESVQTEKKELEEEFSQLKDNYSLLSSQSRTAGHWMYVVPLAVFVLAVLIALRPAD